jgi:hypothetical protein
LRLAELAKLHKLILGILDFATLNWPTSIL